MNNEFKLLVCNDDDIVSFNNNLVKFAQFKIDLEAEFIRKVNYLYEAEGRRSGTQRIFHLVNLSFGSCNLAINLTSNNDGKEFEILRLGSKNWQKGKLRTQALIEFFPYETERAKIHFTLEFSPDEPNIIEPESPLNDLRRMINEENL